MKYFFEKYLGIKITILAVLIAMIFATSTLTIQPKKAEAICCSSCCLCVYDTPIVDFTEWLRDWIEINIHFWLELFLHRLLWWDMTFWQQYMLPMFVQAGNQVAAVGMHQVMTIGMFMDATEQLQTQRLMQQMHAEAHKAYQPSVGMCEFATRVKSLAASERIGEINALLLSERSNDRLLANTGTGASEGTKGDVTLRLNSFRTKYCDNFDNNNSLSYMCSLPASYDLERLNKDIDYQRTLENPWTLDIDLTSPGTASNDEQEVFALANNLYGFDAFIGPSAEKLQNGANVNELQKAYLNMRSVVAKTKVAENSFNALVALKSEGSVGSREFIQAYLKELGMEESEIKDFLGENPSYNAQMEVLTKKAYQSPIFYTNLYDKPVNVERKGVAMQAIGLMQKFDLLKSHLRTEASLSILLELSVEQLQRQVEDNIRN